MRFYLLCLFVSIILLGGCEKETVAHHSLVKNTIDTVIFINQSLEYNLGSFGDEEGAYIFGFPEHAKTCQIIIRQPEERTLFYTPIDSFVGTDTVIVVTERGSDGASESSAVDTVKIVIHVVLNSFHKQLAGEWVWVRSCGGYAGTCWYPDEANTKSYTFGYDRSFSESENGSIVRSGTFDLTDSFSIESTLFYEIDFPDYYVTYIWFVNDTLAIEGGDFVEDYVRK